MSQELFHPQHNSTGGGGRPRFPLQPGQELANRPRRPMPLAMRTVPLMAAMPGVTASPLAMFDATGTLKDLAIKAEAAGDMTSAIAFWRALEQLGHRRPENIPPYRGPGAEQKREPLDIAAPADWRDEPVTCPSCTTAPTPMCPMCAGSGRCLKTGPDSYAPYPVEAPVPTALPSFPEPIPAPPGICGSCHEAPTCSASPCLCRRCLGRAMRLAAIDVKMGNAAPAPPPPPQAPTPPPAAASAPAAIVAPKADEPENLGCIASFMCNAKTDEHRAALRELAKADMPDASKKAKARAILKK